MTMNEKEYKWGFLRETEEMAKKDGIDADTGVHRTGLEVYLEAIFPGKAWIHDKAFGMHGGKAYRIRPDYRCDELKLIVEFDGLPHYKDPKVIVKDADNQSAYESFGYKVVRIPYFIQLTKEVILQMFGREMQEEMFSPTLPSMGVKGANTPAFCCPAGVERMAAELKAYPQQLAVNVKALEEAGNDALTGLSYLRQYL
ncbi:DUF559 domain-containing protein [Segatella buccae]|uniref:DUF559 domain-containing protein n=1 Tax=Segatella buccae TaxID=28126 RepID=UPI0022E7B3FA|nr:DUF559 domain-containing protein [Segatella buccae]